DVRALLDGRSVDPAPRGLTLRRTLAYGAAPLLAWSLYWLAFFPGVITSDPADQWGQVLRGRYTDWHPAFHSWLMWLLTRPTGSLASMAAVQVVVAAALCGALLATLRERDAPAGLVWAAAAWLALAPVYAMNVIAVWKDTAFALAVLGVVLCLARIAAEG